MFSGALAKGDYQSIGFNDIFDRMHWAPRRDILRALPAIREACEIAARVSDSDRASALGR
jgi:hypothetical protein